MTGEKNANAGGCPVIREAENFHGFRTVRFFEAECCRAGRTFRRIPVRASDGADCVALINGAGGAFDGIDIITADEAHCLYSGAVRTGEEGLTALLSSLGYTVTDGGSNG